MMGADSWLLSQTHHNLSQIEVVVTQGPYGHNKYQRVTGTGRESAEETRDTPETPLRGD